MTLFFSHTSSALHDTGTGHPESAARLEVIDKSVKTLAPDNLIRKMPEIAVRDHLLLAHSPELIDNLTKLSQKANQNEESQYIDPDTVMSMDSLEAALYSAGATITATDQVIKGIDKNAFCATRPPGHHAERKRAMGFCLFNNIAIAAKHAVTHLGLERVAVVDFDVHHGNGTQDIFWDHPNLFYASTHEENNFPYSGGRDEVTPDHICNAPLFTGNDGSHLKEAMTTKIFPALIKFRPDMIFISAGFDAHKADPLASLRLIDDDFYWITLKLAEIADKFCNGRIVSTLEGGYNLEALASATAIHIKALTEAAS